MILKAITTTRDGRLTKGFSYVGQFVVLAPEDRIGKDDNGVRFLCFDDKGYWMTFNPKVFRPAP